MLAISACLQPKKDCEWLSQWSRKQPGTVEFYICGYLGWGGMWSMSAYPYPYLPKICINVTCGFGLSLEMKMVEHHNGSIL